MELIMLGTGNATVTKCYNTCFVLQEGQSGFLVDAGGGNGILRQMELAGIRLDSIHSMYITHAHTDHILGAIWVVRMIAQKMLKGVYDGQFEIYTHDKCIQVLETCCRLMLPSKLTRLFGERIFLKEVKDGDTFTASGMAFQCFDIGSTKEKQFGFRAVLPGNTVLACLGDEPFNDRNKEQVEGADWLLCEAFCLYADREKFQPYEKHHSTAADAGRLAAQLRVKNLVLYHTEDKTLDRRKVVYKAEAAQSFGGAVYVPDDLERIRIE